MQFAVASTIELPPFPDREEIAAYCNQGMVRKRPITARTVKRWQQQGFLTPHPAFEWPRRYDVTEVVDFLNMKFKLPGAR